MTIKIGSTSAKCAALFLGLAVVLSACTKSADSSPVATAATKSKEVNLAIWNNYISDDLLKKFTTQTGIKVNVTTYSSNEELLAKVQSGASGFDVAVPSDYLVGVMIHLALLTPIQKAQIPNAADVNDFVLKQSYDPTNEFSLPYAWSTTGIAYNTSVVKGDMKSWKDFFENKAIAGQISMLDDAREVIGAALKLHGHSVNSVKQSELDEAKATLLAQKPRLKMFRSETIDPLMNNEVAVAQVYSSDGLQVEAKSAGKIKYILPSEGGTQAIDNLVIIKGAPNVASAHALINYMLSLDVNVSFVKKVRGGPVLKKTRESLPADLRSSAALFPDPKLLARFEKIIDLGDQGKLYDDLWTEVKTK